MGDSLEQTLDAAIQELDLSISAEKQEQLLNFLQQLNRWNKVYNLTAIDNIDQMLIKHVIDSLSVIPVLEQTKQDLAVETLNIVDVGSGGGLPGVVIALCKPHWKVVCVDAVEKKVAFIKQMRAVLACDNLNALHSRIEAANNLNCDVLITRAFSNLENTIEWGGQHVLPDGYIVAMKGKIPTQELEAIKKHNNWVVQDIHPIAVPFLSAERCVISLKKQGKK